MASRPNLFTKNIDSLAAQTCDDFEQLILWDGRGRGIEQTHLVLHDIGVNGEYVWLLDDDDYARPNAVEIIKANTQDKPPALMCRFIHNENLILPDEQRGLAEGLIGVSSLIVRRDVWAQTRKDFTPRYAGDWDWIKSVTEFWNDYKRIDDIIGGCHRVSKGQGE